VSLSNVRLGECGGEALIRRSHLTSLYVFESLGMEVGKDVIILILKIGKRQSIRTGSVIPEIGGSG
jgi:hypothetical protein